MPLVRLPLTLVQGIEPLLEQLTAVATRALALLDDVEDIPDRIRTVLARAETITGHVEAVVAEATDALRSVQPAVAVLADLDLAVVQALAPLLTDAGTLLAGARQLDPGLVDHAITAVHAVPSLITTIEAELLPALASLEGLVPVVAQLGVQVDHLDGTLEALLAGIPGAARLLKRGATPRPSS